MVSRKFTASILIRVLFLVLLGLVEEALILLMRGRGVNWGGGGGQTNLSKVFFITLNTHKFRKGNFGRSNFDNREITK